jgi:hypothetical protein
MTLPPPKVCRRIAQLFALMGSPNAGEADNARQKINELLAKHNLTWNNLPEIIVADAHPQSSSAASQSQTSSQPRRPTDAERQAKDAKRAEKAAKPRFRKSTAFAVVIVLLVLLGHAIRHANRAIDTNPNQRTENTTARYGTDYAEYANPTASYETTTGSRVGFEVGLPDGRKFGPPETTGEQAIAQVQAHLGLEPKSEGLPQGFVLDQPNVASDVAKSAGIGVAKGATAAAKSKCRGAQPGTEAYVQCQRHVTIFWRK